MLPHYTGLRFRHRRLAMAVCALLVGLCEPLPAQTPGAPAQQPAAPPAAADPLGRDSPFGAVTGFSAAVHGSDFTVAGRYLQAEGRSRGQIENLSRDLSDLLDRYFTQSLTRVSRATTGVLTDGLGADRERIPLTIGERSVDLFLVRVTDPDAGPIWLFSSDSLARVPTLNRSPQATWVERIMPASLVARSFFGLTLAQWILWGMSILAPLLLFAAMARAVVWAARLRIADITGRAVFLQWWQGVRWLIVLGLTLIAHVAALPFLGFSVSFRLAYARFTLLAAIVLGALLIWRLVSVTFHQASLLAIRRGRSDASSLIQLGERVAKVVVVLGTILGLLALAGVDLTTALAGVGLAGVAVALGAQKTVENLLGGIFLVTDRALAVGDYCRLSDREGWVEDITLRSIRLRTVQQTLLSVPAGLLAQGSIENFATRGKIHLQSVLRLSYATTREQLQTILTQTRELLARTPFIDTDVARIRLTSFGVDAIELELFAYIVTTDFATFLDVREKLLLEIARIVESSGSAFAMPTQFIHMQSDAAQAALATTTVSRST